MGPRGRVLLLHLKLPCVLRRSCSESLKQRVTIARGQPAGGGAKALRHELIVVHGKQRSGLRQQCMCRLVR